ncbi:MAG: hypothetical protein J6T10_16310 [Methanobrevibacter sp.]|nr:hypothetical protein [Methanobrevibacter sp.]
MSIPSSSTEFNKELTTATETEGEKKIKYKKNPLIELFIKDYLTAISQPKGRGKKKKKIVSNKFFDTINKMGITFDVEAEEESDEEDVKMETKEDTTTPQPKRSITTRSKAKKKDDMDVDDE